MLQNLCFPKKISKIIQQFGVKLLPHQFQGISMPLHRFLLLKGTFIGEIVVGIQSYPAYEFRRS